MKLHSTRFEKAVRRGVGKALRGSRSLRRARRAARRPGRYSAQKLLRVLLSGLAGAIVAGVFSQTHQVNASIAVITIWCFGLVALQAQRLINALYRSPDLQAFWLLPIEEEAVFRRQLQKFLLGTAWSFVDLVCAYGALALFGHASVNAWIAVIPMAMLNWCQIVAFALLAVVYVGWFPFELVVAAFYVAAFVLFIGHALLGELALNVLRHTAPILNLLLPTGWVPSLFRVFFRHDWSLFLLLIPVAATLGTIRHSLARLRYDYRFHEPIQPEPMDLPLETVAPAMAVEPNSSARVGLTHLEEILTSRAFLQPPTWPEKSRLERALWGWLTPRERILMEFSFPYGLALSQTWKKIFRNLAITAGITLLLSKIVKTDVVYWFLIAGLIITFIQALYLVLHSGRAFNAVFCSGVNIPYYAAYGIGFRELSGMLIKLSAVQFPFFLAYSWAAAILIFFLAGWPLPYGVIWGFKLAGVIFFSRTLLLPFRFSSGTNDTMPLRFRSLLLIPVVLFFSIGFLLAGGASLFVPDQMAAWILFVIAGLIAYGFYRTYGFFFYTRLFDLMNIPQQR